jgi:hypothetical protein
MAITSSQLNHDITQMYNVSVSLSNHLHSYFSLPLEARLRQSSCQRQRWLRLVRLTSSHASSVGSHQQLISLYFPYVENVSTCSLPPPLALDSSCTTASTTSHITPVKQQSTIPLYFTCALAHIATRDRPSLPLFTPTANPALTPPSASVRTTPSITTPSECGGWFYM